MDKDTIEILNDILFTFCIFIGFYLKTKNIMHEL